METLQERRQDDCRADGIADDEGASCFSTAGECPADVLDGSTDADGGPVESPKETPGGMQDAGEAGPGVSSDETPIEQMTAKELGKRGEDAACRYLQINGYEILERNWTCGFGEADIIASDPDGAICFIEVKTRRSIEAGIPEEAITPEKQRRYEKIALSYLVHADWVDGATVRFDAIGICVTSSHRALLRHHKGCFDGIF